VSSVFSRITINVFDSLEKAKAWRTGAEYKEARKTGDKYATFRAYVVEAISPSTNRTSGGRLSWRPLSFVIRLLARRVAYWPIAAFRCDAMTSPLSDQSGLFKAVITVSRSSVGDHVMRV
jgi:hypothetical protein